METMRVTRTGVRIMRYLIDRHIQRILAPTELHGDHYEEAAREEAEILGLTEREAAWLDIARMCTEKLNASLEAKNSTRRWHVLGSSDPRRRKKD